MKRSKLVTLSILGLIAAMLIGGCDKNEVKHCVDENDNVMEESQCEPFDAGTGLQQATDDAGKPMTDTLGHPVYMGHGGGFIYIPRTRWYYGGSSVMSPGTRVSGGSYAPAPGRSYASPSTISRGGFGSTGVGHAGGGAGE